MGVRPIPVPIDADGLIPEGLDKVLGEWDEEKRGCKRPRVLYTVPGKLTLCSDSRRPPLYSSCSADFFPSRR